MTQILNVGYRSTNYYLVPAGEVWLLLDGGWPGTFPHLLHVLKQKDVPLVTIRYLLVTHYHPDHAGVVQELQNHGLQLIVLNQQLPAIPNMRQLIKPHDRYIPITLRDAIVLSCEQSRRFLQSIGIAGEIVATPGHSDDSVTLVLDKGVAFTGDLPAPPYAPEGSVATVQQSWQRITSLGVTMVYPGHGPVQRLGDRSAVSPIRSEE